jgi:hypothetical protein
MRPAEINRSSRSTAAQHCQALKPGQPGLLSICARVLLLMHEHCTVFKDGNLTLAGGNQPSPVQLRQQVSNQPYRLTQLQSGTRGTEG